MAKLLVADDDQRLNRTIRCFLEEQRHVVEIAYDGLAAEHLILLGGIEVAILDWDMPGKDGVVLCRELRERGYHLPILILTGKGSIDHKEQGLDAGADDYLTKPFSLRELAARVKVLLRRKTELTPSTLCVGPLKLDPAKHEILRDGKPIDLVDREFQLLEFFMRHPGTVFNAETILQRVWPTNSESTSDVIRVYINRLRAKLSAGESSSESLIETIPRVGYRLRG